MVFEHHRQPLLPKKDFIRRMWRFTLFAALLVIVSWFIGILGYYFFEHMHFIDAMLNAAMIIGGMGPVSQLYTTGGKLFASFYAVFSGVIFLVSMAIFLAPVIHRLMHKFHIQTDRD